MTRRNEATKATAPKKDRREQNRINQQSFRERKRKEIDDLRAQLDSIKASQQKTSDDKPTGTNFGPEQPEHYTQPRAPLDVAQFGTPAGSGFDRKGLVLHELPDDGTLDPSLLALSSSADFGLPPAPYQPDISKINECGIPFSEPPPMFADHGYNYVPQYDSGSTGQHQISSIDPACDGMPSVTHNMPMDALYDQSTSPPADALASITADYMNAQLLAFKSAEWYARAAEVGIKIATTRQNAWLDKSNLWPQWLLGDAGRNSLLSGTERTIGPDYTCADTSAHATRPPSMDFSNSWHPMIRQDWQQMPADM
ncbi:hypothetical protein Q7P35_002257 [Cladosporium inversicolor]